MKIKDYLKYYIGQKCQYASHHEPQGETYVLTTDKLAEAIEFGDIPELRRIESLTEAEIFELAKAKGLSGARLIRASYEGSFFQIQYMQGGEEKYDHWYKHHMTAPGFHYLLSLGIDLFGLIDAGLAVDAANIKTEEK